MKSTLWLSAAILGLSLITSGAVQADDGQKICTKVKLVSFNNSTIMAGYRVSDMMAQFHTCSPGNEFECEVCANAEYYPKNVGNYLCLPSDLIYEIFPGCQALLDSGASSGCSQNNVRGEVCRSQSTIGVLPYCNWRTNDDAVQATWTWTVSVMGSKLLVDCSNSNYQGTQP